MEKTHETLNGLVETALFVENLERTGDFYENVLGLPKLKTSGIGCVFRVGEQRYLLLFNRKAAHALLELAPAALDLEIIAIADLALYNEDLEKAENLPASWATFRASIKAAHAVLFVTPEYNRSVPAPLKNAIDVGSRPYGKSVWDGKPAAVMSVSPGAIGGIQPLIQGRRSLSRGSLLPSHGKRVGNGRPGAGG